MIIHIQATRSDETLIPDSLRRQYKGKGSLRAYTLAHEGQSRPKIIGKGSVPLYWSRDIIKKLGQVVKKGVKFFAGHNADNSTEGRKPLGEVIASGLKEIKGRLHHMVVGFFPNESALDIQDKDVISMEADITENNNIVEQIKEVTGIAAASSLNETPAFAGARLRLQCFADLFENLNPEPKEPKMPQPITFADVQTAVKNMNIHPSQLYTAEDIAKDSEFKSMAEEVSTLKSDLERITKERDEYKKSGEDALRKTQIAGAVSQLEKHLTEGLTDKQKEFIKSRFNPESFEEINETTLKSHIEVEKEQFSQMAKLFGSSTELDSTPAAGGEPMKPPVTDPVELAMKELTT